MWTQSHLDDFVEDLCSPWVLVVEARKRSYALTLQHGLCQQSSEPLCKPGGAPHSNAVNILHQSADLVLTEKKKGSHFRRCLFFRLAKSYSPPILPVILYIQRTDDWKKFLWKRLRSILRMSCSKNMNYFLYLGCGIQDRIFPRGKEMCEGEG